MDKENNSLMSRKKFLRICGAMLAGGTVAVVTGVLMKRADSEANKKPIDVTSKRDSLHIARKPNFNTPYRMVSAFATDGIVEAFVVCDDKIYVATNNNIFTYNRTGILLDKISTREEIRDLATDCDGNLYALHPTSVSVFSPAGKRMREWQACSNLSDYCAIAVAAAHVFVTDMRNKNICQYTTEGNFVKFINSPHGFVIPSRTFGIVCVGEALYCSNSGRHQVEKYSLNGQYLGCFGQAGTAVGKFTGCCNPVYLSSTTTGEIITSEKGNPRISCYSGNGVFRSLLLDRDMMGGGNIAYNVQIQDDRIFIAGRKQVSIFRYDPRLAKGSACASCSVNCGMV